MPTEYRFDDLDLREEPADPARGDADCLSNNSINGCTQSLDCTMKCCPPTKAC